MRSLKDFLKILKKIDRRSADHFCPFDEIFLNLKIKTKTRRSLIDFKKISNENLPKISKIFEEKNSLIIF
jgi:hypothetical protein